MKIIVCNTLSGERKAVRDLYNLGIKPGENALEVARQYPKRFDSRATRPGLPSYVAIRGNYSGSKPQIVLPEWRRGRVDRNPDEIELMNLQQRIRKIPIVALSRYRVVGHFNKQTNKKLYLTDRID